MKSYSIFTVLLVAAVASAKVYEYGSSDTVFYGDDDHEHVVLSEYILVGTTFYDSVTIKNGGVVFFGNQHNDENLCTTSQDLRVIAPFGNNTNYQFNKVYFRQLFNGSILEEMSKDIALSFPTFETIKLTRSLIVTWEGIHFQPRSRLSEAIKKSLLGEDACKNSIAQLTLATDEVATFAFFKYENMENCHVEENNIWIGFNTGQGYRKDLPMSCQANASSVATTSNIRLNGTYIFRVDEAGLVLWASWYYYTYYWGTWWVWSTIAFTFFIGFSLCLCCCGCIALCSSSKKSKSRPSSSSASQSHHHHHTPTTIAVSFEPPKYTPYTEELM